MSKESKMFYIQTSRVHCGEKKKKRHTMSTISKLMLALYHFRCHIGQ